MSSLFVGQKALRLQYESVDHTALGTTTNKDDAKLLAVLKQQCRIALFQNGTSADVGIVLVHPEVTTPDDPAYRLFAFEIPAKTSMNFDITLMGGLSLDASTRIYVYKSLGSPLAGEKLRAILWG